LNLNRVVRQAIALLVLAAIPTAALAWKIADPAQPFKHKGSGYSVQFPDGWKYAKLWFSDESGATREGPALQSIFVDFRSHKSAFKAIKQKSTSEMLPQDLAQQLVADMTKERGLENVSILADEPAMLAGRPGFRLRFEYRLPVQRGAIRYQEVVIGTVNEKGLYLLGYRAPVLHYFERDLPAFEETLKTFAIADIPARN
jgi:hypothetical protein